MDMVKENDNVWPREQNSRYDDIQLHILCHMYNRRYAHFITRTKNDQLSVDDAKLDSDLQPEVPYKSMGSTCGSSNNSQLKQRAGHLACHTLLLHGKKCMASETACS